MPIPIRGGGRLSGQIGANTHIGVLNMQTASVDASGTPANNYTVVRVRQDLPNRSNVGAIVVNRNATGAFAGPDDVYRSYAVDGRWGMGETVTLSGFAAGTETPGVTGGTHAYNLAASYESERYRYGGGFTEVAPGFNPEASTTTGRGSGRRTSVSACCRTPTPGSSSSTTTSRASTDSVRRAPGAA